MRPPIIPILLCLILFLVGCSGSEHQKKPEGLRLLEVNGCIACHSLDGSKRIGPPLNGVYGSEVVVTTNGNKRTVFADREYLKLSILNPLADVVDGFEPTMPINLKTQIGEKNLDAILDYLESIGKK